MTNEYFHKLCREWSEQEIENHDELYSFLKREYPGVYWFMTTRDSLGHFRLSPLGYDMQVVLKHWQKTHSPIVYRVSRVTGKKPSFTYL